MKKIICFSFIIIISQSLYAQSACEKGTWIFGCSSTLAFSQQDNTKEMVFTIVEEMPVFPGPYREATMMKWIQNKIDSIGYPKKEKEAGISGTCYVTFIINKEGNIVDPHILRGVSEGPGYDKIALEVVNEMPKWMPGKQNGKAVSVKYTLPIAFNATTPVKVEK